MTSRAVQARGRGSARAARVGLRRAPGRSSAITRSCAPISCAASPCAASTAARKLAPPTSQNDTAPRSNTSGWPRARSAARMRRPPQRADRGRVQPAGERHAPCVRRAARSTGGQAAVNAPARSRSAGAAWRGCHARTRHRRAPRRSGWPARSARSAPVPAAGRHWRPWPGRPRRTGRPAAPRSPASRRNTGTASPARRFGLPFRIAQLCTS